MASAAHTSLASATHTTLAARYEQPSPPRFTAFGVDLERPGALELVTRQIAHQREIILVCGDAAPTAGTATHLNTVKQLRALRLHHILFISDSAASCAALRAGDPHLACVWSSRINASKPQHDGICVGKHWSFAFYFYDLRKHYAARMTIDLGLNVLQTDTDAVWLASPYPALKAVYGQQQIVAMADRPLLNAGVFYAQNVARGDGAAWVLEELARRIHLFLLKPEAVKWYVPWAQPPFYANADEQTLMNDCVRSSIANKSSYAQATAGWEVKRHKTGTIAMMRTNKSFHWKRTPEYKMLGWLESQVRARARRSKLAEAVRLDGLCDAPTLSSAGTVWPLHSVGSSAAPAASFAVAPSWLFMPFPSSTSSRQLGRCAAFDARTAANASASTDAAGTLGVRWPTYDTLGHRAPFVMGHLASVRTGAWSRRALMRAHGWWHPGADALLARNLGWTRRRGHLALVVGSPPPGAAAAAAAAPLAPPLVESVSGGDVDTLVGNLLVIAAALHRRPVLPELPCAILNRTEVRKLTAGGLHSLRPVAGRRSVPAMCAWVPPRDCWRVDYLTALEFEMLPPDLHGPADDGAAEGRRLADTSPMWDAGSTAGADGTAKSPLRQRRGEAMREIAAAGGRSVLGDAGLSVLHAMLGEKGPRREQAGEKGPSYEERASDAVRSARRSRRSNRTLGGSGGGGGGCEGAGWALARALAPSPAALRNASLTTAEDAAAAQWMRRRLREVPCAAERGTLSLLPAGMAATATPAATAAAAGARRRRGEEMREMASAGARSVLGEAGLAVLHAMLGEGGGGGGGAGGGAAAASPPPVRTADARAVVRILTRVPLLRHPLRQLRPLAAAYRAALNGTTADGRRPRAQPEREEADAKCVASLYRQRGRASPGPAK